MRNTILFISVLAVVAALLLGFNLGRNLKPTTYNLQPTPTPLALPSPTISQPMRALRPTAVFLLWN